MGNRCAYIPNAVPKAKASPSFPQTRHDDKECPATTGWFFAYSRTAHLPKSDRTVIEALILGHNDREAEVAEDGKKFGAAGQLVDAGRRQDVRNPLEALTEGPARLRDPP
jgi:hypothetical protein